MSIKDRFRGFLPVVVDVETAGIDPMTNALLEICIVLIHRNNHNQYIIQESFSEHILPFEGAILDEASLAFNQIDPYQPLRFAVNEEVALPRVFAPIRQAIKQQGCQRAVLVGHNAWFDLLFVKEAAKRTKIQSPFHAFTCFDTATLGGFLYGQTVLAKLLKAANIPFDTKEAHSAVYDAVKTAELFCTMLNEHEHRMRHLD